MAQPLSARGAKQYSELQDAIAEAYGIDNATRMFSVDPTIAQELNDAITAKADFLERINVIPVSEIKGEKVFIGVNGPVTGRTNTKTTDREADRAVGLVRLDGRLVRDGQGCVGWDRRHLSHGDQQPDRDAQQDPWRRH